MTIWYQICFATFKMLTIRIFFRLRWRKRCSWRLIADMCSASCIMKGSCHLKGWQVASRMYPAAAGLSFHFTRDIMASAISYNFMWNPLVWINDPLLEFHTVMLLSWSTQVCLFQWHQKALYGCENAQINRGMLELLPQVQLEYLGT